MKEADIVVTNPPFSAWKEYLATLVEYDKKFLIVGNKNAVTYKEVFPLIKADKLWSGVRDINKDFWLIVSSGNGYERTINGKKTKHIMACWFSNLDHEKRHELLLLMTMEDNIRFSKHKTIRENGYQKYDNYDAIEVPYTDAIPKDYIPDPQAGRNGIMGVPIMWLDKYCPERFEIVSINTNDKENIWGNKNQKLYN